MCTVQQHCYVGFEFTHHSNRVACLTGRKIILLKAFQASRTVADILPRGCEAEELG